MAFRWWHGVKLGVLLVTLLSLALAWWWMLSPQPLALRADSVAAGGTMAMEGFRYSEYWQGKPAYLLTGQRMHDESARLGDLRIAALRVMHIRKPVIMLLQPGFASGWQLQANQGRMIAGKKQLTLQGEVRGSNTNGGRLWANSAVIDSQHGTVQLRNGFELSMPGRHERGSQTTL